MRKNGFTLFAFCAAAFFFLFCGVPASADADRAGVSGTVRDSSGAPVADARVVLLNAQQSVIAVTTSGPDGKYAFDDVNPGSYEVNATGGNGLIGRAAVTVDGDHSEPCDLVLAVSPLVEAVSVTADIGQVQDKDQIGQSINIVPKERLAQRASSGLSEVANEEVGVSQQRTSPTVAGIVVRGLTARNVSVFVDGIRFTTSVQRGGVSTFFNTVDPSELRAVEILRGPNSSQYGSDSIGGSVQLVTNTVPFTQKGIEFHGQNSVFGSSANQGFGNASRFTLGGRNFGLSMNLFGRRSNPLRTGQGVDSRSAVTRFFGLPSDAFYDNRVPDSGFTEYGGSLKFNYAFRPKHQLQFSYQRANQDGAKRPDQLLGGDGNLIAAVSNVMLDFGYLRYDTQAIPFLDTFSIGTSYNAQRENRFNQGGQGNATGAITSQYEKLRANGVQMYGSKVLPGRHTVLAGADFYRERVTAPAYDLNPVNGVTTPARPRVPNGAIYNNYGFYAQDVWDAIPERLRISTSLRYGVTSYQARSGQNPTVDGRPLVVDDSIRNDAFTFRVSGVFNAYKGFSVAGSVSRGFRAPSITDLGTLGLQGNGVFEVASPNLVGLSATVGTTADANAVSTGTPVRQVTPERSMNYEGSLRYRDRRIDTDFTGFVTNIDGVLTSQTLILPQGAVGTRLGSELITSQNANGAVFVVAATNAVRVRTNFTNARIYGFEYTLDVKVTEDLTVGGNFTWIHSEDRATGLAPNIEGGTPPPMGVLRARYQPAGKRYWVETSVVAANRQDRLSSLDLDDRRIGAPRSRTQIQNFFRRGATVRGFVSPGPDGVFGNADDTLRLTGETLAQIQNRVLGAATSAPQFRAVNGYATWNLRGGYRFNERHEVLLGLENILDKNYRGISWGTDAPGRNFTVRYTVRF